MIRFFLLSMRQDPFGLFGAAILLIVSAILAVRALRPQPNDIAARIALIAPWTQVTPPLHQRASDAAEEPSRGAVSSIGGRETWRRLKSYGIPARHALSFFFAIQAWVAVCLSVGSWFLAPYLIAASASLPLRAVLAGSAGVLGWFVPVLAARWATKRRADAIVAGLPDALELLVICAEGGLALGDGIDRIVTELQRSQPELAEELALTAADLKILPSQDQALERLAARIDAPIVQSVVTALSQTMRYGTPFAQAMRVAAAEIRNDALVRLEERANKLPALLTVPMILFILPTIFLVVGGPAGLRLMDSLMQGLR